MHVLRGLLDTFLSINGPQDILWYYTPMALEFSAHVNATRVYDCMDELSMFAGAPPHLRAMEAQLLASSAVVFTGGKSLYYSKRRLHHNVYCFPSAVDALHFSGASRPEPEVLAGTPRPRIGFYGVIDERLDVAYVEELARNLREWTIVMVGPVVKIDPAVLPQAKNIVYAGMQPYEALPALLEHWDVAMLPFALNDATRYISPTKTLEYLAAGKPVVSSPIADVVDPYGKEGLVHIAASGAEAAEAARALLERGADPAWTEKTRAVVASASWDNTVQNMRAQLEAVHSLALENAG